MFRKFKEKFTMLECLKFINKRFSKEIYKKNLIQVNSLEIVEEMFLK